MKTTKKLAGIITALCVLCAFILTFRAFAGPPPILTITSLGTNQFSITITNSIGTNDYDLLWTPVLANSDYPWTWAALGAPGETNYLLNMGNYQSGFFVALLDTNAVPLWEAADPNNPGAGILTVYIDSPTNGMVLQ